MKRIFNFLKSVKTIDSEAEEVALQMIDRPGAKITNCEASFDKSSPWYDCEFDFLGESFILRFLVPSTSNQEIVEVMHDGECRDVPMNRREHGFIDFVIEEYFGQYRKRVELALGSAFKFAQYAVHDMGSQEFEINGSYTVDQDEYTIAVTVRTYETGVDQDGKKCATISAQIFGKRGEELANTNGYFNIFSPDGMKGFVEWVNTKVDEIGPDPREYAENVNKKVFEFPGEDRDRAVTEVAQAFLDRFLPDGYLVDKGHYFDEFDGPGADIVKLGIKYKGRSYVIKFKRYPEDRNSCIVAKSGTYDKEYHQPHVLGSLRDLGTFLTRMTMVDFPGQDTTPDDYLAVYRAKEADCINRARREGDANEWNNIFEETCKSYEIVGYYVAFYGDEAYNTWKTNIQGSTLSPVQAEADKLFEALYNKPKPCPFCSGEKVQADFSDAYMMRGDAENIMVVYSPNGVAQAKFTIHACPICKKPL